MVPLFHFSLDSQLYNTCAVNNHIKSYMMSPVFPFWVYLTIREIHLTEVSIVLERQVTVHDYNAHPPAQFGLQPNPSPHTREQDQALWGKSH